MCSPNTPHVRSFFSICLLFFLFGLLQEMHKDGKLSENEGKDKISADGSLPEKPNISLCNFSLFSISVRFKYFSSHCSVSCVQGKHCHVKEVNRLERVLLVSLDFDLRIEETQYQLYEATLRGRWLVPIKSRIT